MIFSFISVWMHIVSCFRVICHQFTVFLLFPAIADAATADAADADAADAAATDATVDADALQLRFIHVIFIDADSKTTGY